MNASLITLLWAAMLATSSSLVQSFTPSFFTRSSISRLMKETPRFQPRPSSLLDDDEDEDEYGVPADEDDADFLVNVGELEGGDVDDEVGSQDDGVAPAWAASQERMDTLRQEHRRHDKDTGSPEFQIAGMTERIAYLTTHLKDNPKDFSTRRGLVALVNKRRRLLNYLFRENVETYMNLVNSLGIRHKAPGSVTSREDKYSRFPKQKAVKKHLVKKKK